MENRVEAIDCAVSDFEPPSGGSSDLKGKVVGRFAPSPTGRMHAGNIFAALVAWLIAKSQDGDIVLRIEDLDRERSKQAYIDDVQRDFERLGLTWDFGPYYQHDRDEAYQAAFDELKGRGLVYPCFCSRADLHAASAPHRGEKFVYPGTCRHLDAAQIADKQRLKQPAYRLAVPDETYFFVDAIQGECSQNLATECGDFLIKRSDGAFAYQLAVVVDDAAQGVNFVTRGVDLLSSTPQQIYLQKMLGLPTCNYAHIPLLVSQQDRRLSKRDKDASIDALMDTYGSASAVIGHIAYVAGMVESDEPATPQELLRFFDLRKLSQKWSGEIQMLWH